MNHNLCLEIIDQHGAVHVKSPWTFQKTNHRVPRMKYTVNVSFAVLKSWIVFEILAQSLHFIHLMKKKTQLFILPVA